MRFPYQSSDWWNCMVACVRDKMFSEDECPAHEIEACFRQTMIRRCVVGPTTIDDVRSAAKLAGYEVGITRAHDGHEIIVVRGGPE